MRNIAWLILSILFFCGVGLICGYWYLSVNYVWDRDFANQRIIGKAYAKFYLTTKRFPTSLEELVKGGYLPQTADFYREPPGLFSRSVDARLSCYTVCPPPANNVENLQMVGRRKVEDGDERVRYEPMINAFVRDAIIAAQVPRNEEAYSNYVAPIEGRNGQAKGLRPP